MSTKGDLEAGAATAINGLGLKLNGTTAVNVVQGIAPKVEEGLESGKLPLVYVAASERADRSRLWDTSSPVGVRRRNEYLVEIVAFVASNRDPTYGAADVQDWVQAIVKALAASPEQVGVSITGGNVYDVEVEFDPTFDRQAWMELYLISALNLIFICIEPAA